MSMAAAFLAADWVAGSVGAKGEFRVKGGVLILVPLATFDLGMAFDRMIGDYLTRSSVGSIAKEVFHADQKRIHAEHANGPERLTGRGSCSGTISVFSVNLLMICVKYFLPLLRQGSGRGSETSGDSSPWLAIGRPGILQRWLRGNRGKAR